MPRSAEPSLLRSHRPATTGSTLDADFLSVLDAARSLDAGNGLADDHDVLLMHAPRYCEVVDRAHDAGLISYGPTGLLSLTEAGRAALAAAA